MKLFKEINYKNAVFIDIETVSGLKAIDPVKTKALWESWDYKMRYTPEYIGAFNSLVESYQTRSSLYSEFGKIVVITIGMIIPPTDKSPERIHLRTFKSHDEKELLQEFTEVMNGIVEKNPRAFLCGHSIIGFDAPYILKRCIINGVEPNRLFDTGNLKPWELDSVMKDISVMWKGTSFYPASLLAMSNALGLASPKTDIDGSETSQVYWKDKSGLDRIAKYCERDVVTTINIVRKIRFEEVLEVPGIFEVGDNKTSKVLNTKKKKSKIVDEDEDNYVEAFPGEVNPPVDADHV